MAANNCIRIAQWNSRSIKTRIPEICYHSNFDIFLISETWLTMVDQIYVKGFDVVKRDRFGRPGGGVLILVRSSLKYQMLDTQPPKKKFFLIWGSEHVYYMFLGLLNPRSI